MPHTPEDINRRIWNYYQNQAETTFAGAVPRLEALVRRARRLGPGDRPRVLGIGAGNGHLERTALAAGLDIRSLDPDATTVERLRGEGIDARQGHMEALPFADAHFDCVIASEVLEHLADDARRLGIAEVARVLRPGGHFIGTVPFREDLSQNIVLCPHCGEVFHRWGHQASFDRSRLERELGASFARVRTRVTGFPDLQHGPRAALQGLARLGLAWLRVPISSTSLYFQAGRPRRP